MCFVSILDETETEIDHYYLCHGGYVFIPYACLFGNMTVSACLSVIIFSNAYNINLFRQAEETVQVTMIFHHQQTICT